VQLFAGWPTTEASFFQHTQSNKRVKVLAGAIEIYTTSSLFFSVKVDSLFTTPGHSLNEESRYNKETDYKLIARKHLKKKKFLIPKSLGLCSF